jgi:carboxyl-terminal processing protease
MKGKYLSQVTAAESFDEAAVVINRMLAELQTSHTVLYTQNEPEYYHILDIFKTGPLGEQIHAFFPEGNITYPGIGIITKMIDQQVFVTGILEGSPADRIPQLHIGCQILSVNDQPYQPVKSFRGFVGQKVPMIIQCSAETEGRESVDVIPDAIQPSELFLSAMEQSLRLLHRNGQNIGYIHIWSYAGEQYHNLLVREIAFGKLKDADSLILDLRDGLGGANPNYLNIFNHQVPVMTVFDREGQKRIVDFQWRKPVAMLVNEGTRSGKEILAHGFKKFGIGPVVGSKTAGAVTGGRPFLLQNGSLLYLAVQGSLIDGEKLEGKGVLPDVQVAFPVEYCNGHDPQLEKALTILANYGR